MNQTSAATLDFQKIREFKDRYHRRRKKITKGMLIIGFPLVLAGGAGVGFIVWAALYYWLSGSLIQNGRFVPSKITNFNAEQGGISYGEQMLGSAGIMLIDWIGYLVPTPTRAIHIEFKKNGKVKKRHQLLMKKEEVEFDELGNGWCFIDEKGMNPLTWFVTYFSP